MVAEILQGPSNIAATVFTTGADSQHTHIEDPSKTIYEKQDNFTIALKSNSETKVQQEKKTESLSDTEKNIKEYCKKGGYEEDSFLYSYWPSSHLISAKENQIRQENIYQEKPKDDKKSRSTAMKGNKSNSKFGTNEAKQKFEENTYSSHYINDM